MYLFNNKYHLKKIMTEKGIELIKRFEGFRSDAYQDSVGVWTIGYGATYYMNGNKVKKGDKITQADAEKLLNEMSEKKYGKYVDLYVTQHVTPYMRDALISFAYNLGNGSLKSSTLLKKVNLNPNDTSIRNEFMRWTKAGGKELAGLVKRRKAEADLYFTDYVEKSVEPEPIIEPEPVADKKKLTFKGHIEK